MSDSPFGDEFDREWADDNEIANLIRHLDRHHADLEAQVWHDDTVGCIWFGDRPGWMDQRVARLYEDPPK
ncbi:hypothetical protein [Mycobacterium sp.]|uniref:hypothetical protein n=1 Tax=Mycobacterium sp. TaxID=1785 RepID=UPI003D1198E6